MLFTRNVGMSFVLLYITFGILITVSDSKGVCNFRGIANCWNDVIKRQCAREECNDEDFDICKDRALLAECFQVNCENSKGNNRCWSELFTGKCSNDPQIKE